MALFYFFQYSFKINFFTSKSFLNKSNLIYCVPLVFVLLNFFWVVSHYLIFSQFAERQYQELTSTWLRSVMASLIGAATAIAYINNKKYRWLLWLGLIFSFLILFFQYIPKALANQSLMAYDPFGNYIYYAKFNRVLAGVILISGTLSILFDKFFHINSDNNQNLKKLNIYLLLIFGLLLPFYSFITIFNAKNGVGTSVIIFAFFILYCFTYLYLHNKLKNIRNLMFRKNSFVYSIFFIFFIFFLIYHIKSSPGWSSLIEDIIISIQINDYKKLDGSIQVWLPN